MRRGFMGSMSVCWPHTSTLAASSSFLAPLLWFLFQRWISGMVRNGYMVIYISGMIGSGSTSLVDHHQA